MKLAKKAQISNVILFLVIFCISAFVLVQFMPTIEQFRLDAINDIQDNPATSGTLYTIIMYGLKPIIWIGFIFLSLVALIVTVNAASQNPI